MSNLVKYSLVGSLILISLQALANHSEARPSAVTIAHVCESCHGASGHGVGAIPSIANMPEQQFIITMQEYREGRRLATVMNRIARGYQDQDFVNLARFFR